jgi:GTP-binding protein
MKFDNAQFETSFGVAKQLMPSDMPEVAFSGRSNVGKSSLLNRLMNRKSLARVSSMPGKTVTINFFKLDGCRLVDLPGYGYAKVSHDEKIRWSELMETYFSSGRDIRLVVQLIDMRHAPSQQDIDMIEYMVECGIPFVLALTKADKLNKTERINQLEFICSIAAKYGEIPVVPFSATKGDGADELRRLIEKHVNDNN